METNCSDVVVEHEQSFTCGLYDFLIETVLMGALCTFGFVGNMLSAVCLLKDKSKSATPFLLVSLELADTLFLVTVLLLRAVTSVDTFTGSLQSMAVYTSYVGKYVYPLAMITNTGTIYLTVLVTVNRYISVCKPYDVLSLCSIANARKQVIVVWLFSIAFNIPRCFMYDIEEYCRYAVPVPSSYDSIPSADVAAADVAGSESEVVGGVGSEGEEVVWRMRSYPTWLTMDPIFQQVYVNVLYCLIMFLLPLLSLVVLNFNLILALRETRRKRENMRSRRFVAPSSAAEFGGGGGRSSMSSRSEDDITLMLIVVVVIFVVSQSPALVTQILAVFLHEGQMGCPNYFFFYERISDLLVVANSSVNFIAYCFCSRRFRKILLSLLRGGRSTEPESVVDAAPATVVPAAGPGGGDDGGPEVSGQTVDRGGSVVTTFLNSSSNHHEDGRSTAKKSFLHRMTHQRNAVKTKNFALSDIKELHERKPIV